MGSETFEGLEPATEVIGVDEVIEVALELTVVLIMEAPDGGVFDGAVHALDLAVRPRMLWLGQSVIDVLEGAGIFEGVGAEEFLACDHFADLGGAPGFALGVGEVGAVIGEHGMDLVGHSLDQGAQEVGCGARCCLGVQFGEGELAGAVDGDEEVEFAFSGLNFCDVDMEEADGIGFEFLLRRLLALRIRKPGDAVPLQAAVRGRQGRDDRVSWGIVA